MPVGTYEPNGFGLFDTAGNVSEWTCSGWSEEFDGSEQRCDREPGQHVTRGGSMKREAVFLRSSARAWGQVNHRNDTIGFRVWCSKVEESRASSSVRNIGHDGLTSIYASRK